MLVDDEWVGLREHRRGQRKHWGEIEAKSCTHHGSEVAGGFDRRCPRDGIRVAAGHSVICPDLRGYGRSSAPAPRPDHSQASMRAMAGDVVDLMRQLGHERFAAVGHDRGSYVALRLAMEHPPAVTHLAVLDSVPIGEALARADARFAAAWWHWFFLAQPEVPERVITADPDAWYGTGEERAARMGEGNYADYLNAIRDPAKTRPSSSGTYAA